ncbi:RsiV family protein [Crocinitomicaceae bacterium]|nr:RsiV family protein [Crocinitomicaceae bacterium]
MRGTLAFVFLMLAGTLLLSSCKMWPASADRSLPPRIVSGTATKALVSVDSSDTSEFYISYNYFSHAPDATVCDSVYKDSVNDIISGHVSYVTLADVDDSFEDLSHSFFESRLDAVAQQWDSIKRDGDVPWSLEFQASIRDRPSYAELVVSSWLFAGGAHGNGHDAYYLIDRASGRSLTLSDFVTDTEALTSIVERYFREEKVIGESESLSDYGFWFDNDEFVVSENFKTAEDALIFFYNFYEIAPYIEGPTQLTVPISEIQHLLKRDF